MKAKKWFVWVLVVLIVSSLGLPVMAANNEWEMDPDIAADIQQAYNRSASELVVASANAEMGGTAESSGYYGPVWSYKGYPKYNEYYWGERARDVDSQYFAWCGAFVGWVATQSGMAMTGTIPSVASVTNMNRYMVQDYGYEEYNVMSLTCFNGNDYTPVPGDILFYRKSNGFTCHVGYIVEVGEDYIKTVEGNMPMPHPVDTCTYTYDNAPSTLVRGTVVHVEYPTVGPMIEQYLYSLGFNSAVVSGIMANFERDTQLNPNNMDGINFNDADFNYGLCQWDKTSGRFANLCHFTDELHLGYNTLMGQLRFMQSELQGLHWSLYNTLLDLPNTADGARMAALMWYNQFEERGGEEKEVIEYAMTHLTLYGNYEETLPECSATGPETGAYLNYLEDRAEENDLHRESPWYVLPSTTEDSSSAYFGTTAHGKSRVAMLYITAPKTTDKLTVSVALKDKLGKASVMWQIATSDYNYAAYQNANGSVQIMDQTAVDSGRIEYSGNSGELEIHAKGNFEKGATYVVYLWMAHNDRGITSSIENGTCISVS